MSNNELGYAGDITPQTANEWMQSGSAVMVDVRTEAELAWAVSYTHLTLPTICSV